MNGLELKELLDITVAKAVKEFAANLKAVIPDCNFVDGYAEIELYDKVDELLKEYEKEV